MDYITIQEVAEKWGLKERRVQVMCQEEIILAVVYKLSKCQIRKAAINGVLAAFRVIT